VTTATASMRALPGDDLRRLWSLTWILAVTEWRLRFYGSVLGYLWSLARPFALFGVIYVVFSEFANFGEGVPYYAAYILLALVLFQFFIEVTTTSVRSLVERENLLRKVPFPRLAVPFSVALTALFNLGMTLIAVAIFAAASGVTPRWSWLELPVLVLILLVFALGTGMLLSVLYVRHRDIQPIWEVVSQALFYASPVLYVATMIPEDIQRPYHVNPLAALLTEMRAAVIDPQAAHAWVAIGGAERLLIPGAIVAGTFALGWWAFNRAAPRIAEHL
jgi:ABC-2 type transport system permease protein